ncbi:MAG: hypothetical protein EB036_14870 [Betaproteobacteria bacterium]|nr:hypothetical protein [Betaproteobacteria bacterium]
MKPSKAIASSCLTLGLMAGVLMKPALGQHPAEENQREQAGQQALTASGLAASGPNASHSNSTSNSNSTSHSNSTSQHDSNAMPDPAGASSVDADGAALQAAIRQAMLAPTSRESLGALDAVLRAADPAWTYSARDPHRAADSRLAACEIPDEKALVSWFD